MCASPRQNKRVSQGCHNWRTKRREISMYHATTFMTRDLAKNKAGFSMEITLKLV